jgi:hypothetical protein
VSRRGWYTCHPQAGRVYLPHARVSASGRSALRRIGGPGPAPANPRQGPGRATDALCPRLVLGAASSPLWSRCWAAAREWSAQVAGRRACRALAGAAQVSVFAALEAPALQPLPRKPFVLAPWSRAMVGEHPRAKVGRTIYSIPWQFIGQRVDARSTPSYRESSALTRPDHNRDRPHRTGNSPSGSPTAATPSGRKPNSATCETPANAASAAAISTSGWHRRGCRGGPMRTPPPVPIGRGRTADGALAPVARPGTERRNRPPRRRFGYRRQFAG